MSEQTQDFVLRRSALLWVAFYGAILLAWIALGLMAAQVPGFGIMRFTAPQIWEALCTSARNAEPVALFLMWAMMALAMMLPTFVPSLRTYRDLSLTGASTNATSAALIGGYLVVWLGFSALAAAAQKLLSDLALVGPDGASLSLTLTAALLFAAGAYQFSSLKDACLSRCRSPLAFFMERWQQGAASAFGMGLHLGVFCLGCCWALMALGFVGGTMNLIWMGLATVFMALEKLPDIGRYLTRPAGHALLLAGGVTALAAAGVL